MNWLPRASLLLWLSLALAVCAAALLFWTPAVESRPEPQPVRAGDVEIAFLDQATNGANWERFASAVALLPGSDLGDAFPPQTTAVPEVRITPPGYGNRLLFRWYKLTSTNKPRDWVEALLRRAPPPVAVMGGGTSDAARDLAVYLARAARPLAATRRPLLLLTTATAERVEGPSEATQDGKPDTPDRLPGVRLTRLYPGRTFRFCFTNRQMAEAVTHFLWSQPELRPDGPPVYTVQWQDDAYSGDLTTHFGLALSRQLGGAAVTRDWGWLAGAAATGGTPLSVESVRSSHFRRDDAVHYQYVKSSVGGFDRPNHYESDAATWLIDDLGRQGEQRRPLLVLSGQAAPARRFLHALKRTERLAARRFIVATGDTLGFDTVYRDRTVDWPIQDLPFTLVFFCHRNPIDRAAGFDPGRDIQVNPSGATGTEDLLLFQDLAAALVQAVSTDGELLTDTDQLAERLRQARLPGGGSPDPDSPLFDAAGDRRAGSGEHIVWLSPVTTDDRVLPAARITVWTRLADGSWAHQDTPLDVHYDNVPREGGEARAD